jgi:hypothetical protein
MEKRNAGIKMALAKSCGVKCKCAELLINTANNASTNHITIPYKIARNILAIFLNMEMMLDDMNASQFLNLTDHLFVNWRTPVMSRCEPG